MWRGTYMIYKVVHNMTPGNMTTTVTAMKMNKFATPFNTSFFTRLPHTPKAEESCDGNTNVETSNSTVTVIKPNDSSPVEKINTKPGLYTNKSRNQKLKMCGITSTSMSPSEVKKAGLIVNVTFNQTGGTKTLPMNKYIAEDFKAICNEILALGWFKLNVGNCFRDKNSITKGVSRHCWGIAVDINPGTGGNPWFNTRISRSQKELNKGDKAPWGIRKCPYNGGYDRSKCIWHYEHPVVKIFLAHGWGWGGSYGDVMHFSVDDGH